MNRYNDLERTVVRSTELKRYSDLSNSYTFHESFNDYRIVIRFPNRCND
jgi:hypothetical protein